MNTARHLSRFITTLGLALAGCGWATSAGAAPVALSSSGHVKAFAQASMAGTMVTNTNQFQSANPLQDFRISTGAHSEYGTDYRIEAQSMVDVEADWVDAAQGSVHISAALGGRGVQSGLLALGLSPRNWSYRFQATQDGVFRLQYDTALDVTSASTLGLGGYLFGWDGATTVLGLDKDGVLEIALHAGDVHEVSLTAWVGWYGAFGSQSTAENGFFQWQIDEYAPQAVPEPASLALIGLGLGLLGLRRGRQRG